jgi:xanthine dehydrogenase small subunit
MPVRDRVRFFMNGELVELADVDPTRTVLQYLREDCVQTGTKEGCAEGDCGACTVVLVALDAAGTGLTVRAVNACIQFLATLDGKELLTIESLAAPGGQLHPVQQAMVDEHGSQCGFCTPGFVMSLFALFKSDSAPDRVAIDNALAGNLCRCTGYRPIVAAARRMYELADNSSWLTASAGANVGVSDRVARLAMLQDDADLVVAHDDRRFLAPATVAALAKAMLEQPSATLLAGGTDVGLWVTKHYRDLDPVIYIGRVGELAVIRVADSTLHIGAGVTLTEAVPHLVEHYPDFEEMFLRWASPPIRNAATLVGNVANGSPIGDSMPALMAVGTEVVLRKGSRRRSLPLEAFYVDYQVKDLEPGEFVERISVPLPTGNTVARCYKVSKRFDQDISAVCLGVSFVLDDAVARNVRLAYGGMAATVRRATHAEQAIEGRRLNDATIAAAMDAIDRDFDPISDMRATASYRREISKNLIKRLQLDMSGKTTSVYRYGRAS